MGHNSIAKQLRQYSQDLIAYKMGAEFADACNDAADAIERLSAELEQVKRERDAAEQCIYSIEDALDRGSDNDWAREAIAEYEETLKKEE